MSIIKPRNRTHWRGREPYKTKQHYRFRRRHDVTHELGGFDELNVEGLPGELADAQKLEVSKNGTSIGIQPEVNLIEGSHITLAVTENIIEERIDVNIDSFHEDFIHFNDVQSVSSGSSIPVGESSPKSPKSGISGEMPTLDFDPAKTTAVQVIKQLPLASGTTITGFKVTIVFTTDTIPIALDTLTIIVGVSFANCLIGSTIVAPSFTTTVIPDAAIPPGTFITCVDTIISPITIRPGDIMNLTFWRSKTDIFAGKLKLIALNATMST